MEILWYKNQGRVASGRRKYEDRFFRGVWVGKSETDDSHLVIDLERGVQRSRTVRRMPIEFRWNHSLLELIEVTPWSPAIKKEPGAAGVPRHMYITEKMIDWFGPTDDCPKCSTGKGSHSVSCRQRFEKLQSELLAEKLAKEGEATQTQARQESTASASTQEVRTGPGAAPVEAGAEAQMEVSLPQGEKTARSEAAGSAGPEAAEDAAWGELQARVKRRALEREQPAEETSTQNMMIGGLAVCELDNDDESDPLWDPIPVTSNRRPGRCGEHEKKRMRRLDRYEACTCRQCVIMGVAPLAVAPRWFGVPENENEEQLEPEVHYDYYTGEPLDEELYQQGKNDELMAMQEYGVYEEVDIQDAVGGKHIRGFPIARMKQGMVRWRWRSTRSTAKTTIKAHRR